MNEIQNKVKEIKQLFRQLMDGATAASMRHKGMNYKLNWGASLPMLHKMAVEIGHDYNLAIALWKEDVRECKILATMLMPPEQILPDVVDIWMEQTPNIEIAEQAVFNLYQYLPYAADLAYRCIASSESLRQLCGFHILSRLFMQKQEPNERGIHEFVDQALCAMLEGNVSVRKAAFQSMIHLGDLSLMHQRIVDSALRQYYKQIDIQEGK